VGELGPAKCHLGPADSPGLEQTVRVVGHARLRRGSPVWRAKTTVMYRRRNPITCNKQRSLVSAFAVIDHIGRGNRDLISISAGIEIVKWRSLNMKAAVCFFILICANMMIPEFNMDTNFNISFERKMAKQSAQIGHRRSRGRPVFKSHIRNVFSWFYVRSLSRLATSP
jgi:hypothetical protein